MSKISQEILERNLAAAGPGFVRPADYAAIHGMTRGAVDYYISCRSLRMADGSEGIRRVNHNYYVHKDAYVKREYKPRARFNFGRKAVCAAIALSVYNPVYAASDYVILNDGQQTVVHSQEHIHRPLIFKQKHPVFWRTTAPFRRFVWHPLVMVGKKSGFNKVASIASDSFIKFGDVTQPYHNGATTVNTLLGLGATAGLYIRGK